MRMYCRDENKTIELATCLNIENGRLLLQLSEENENGELECCINFNFTQDQLIAFKKHLDKVDACQDYKNKFKEALKFMSKEDLIEFEKLLEDK